MVHPCVHSRREGAAVDHNGYVGGLNPPIRTGTYCRGLLAARRQGPLTIDFGWMDGPALGVAHERAAPRQVVRVMCATAMLTAVVSAALLLWLAAGDGAGGGLRGVEARCVYRFEDGDGNTSICDRVRMGARGNVACQISLAVVCGVLALRARQPLVWLRAAVAISVAVTVLCYVFMRSWEFGLGQSLL